MAEWSIAHAWKACKPNGFMGSNPISSTMMVVMGNGTFGVVMASYFFQVFIKVGEVMECGLSGMRQA